MKLAKLACVAAVLGMVCGAYADAPPARPERPQRPQGLMGTVKEIQQDKLIITTRERGAAEGKEVTVATDADTKVSLDGKDAKLGDLKAGMFVFITPTEGVAKDIRARSPGLRGRIVKVEGDKVVVRTFARGGQGQEVTVATDADTKVTVDDKDGKLADLKADMFVNVTPPEGTAKTIAATTAAARGPGGGGPGGRGPGGRAPGGGEEAPRE